MVKKSFNEYKNQKGCTEMMKVRSRNPIMIPTQKIKKKRNKESEGVNAILCRGVAIQGDTESYDSRSGEKGEQIISKFPAKNGVSTTLSPEEIVEGKWKIDMS